MRFVDSIQAYAHKLNTSRKASQHLFAIKPTTARNGLSNRITHSIGAAFDLLSNHSS